MSDVSNVEEESVEEEIKPFVAPCNDLKPSDPFKWLRAGWSDYRSALGLSLAWGVFCFLLSVVVAVAAWRAGGLAWLIGLVSQLILIRFWL